MTSTSGGSRPDPKHFLDWYAKSKEGEIQDLLAVRVPGKGDYALKGREDLQTIKGMANAGIIQV